MKKNIAILVSKEYGPLSPYPDDALLLHTFEKMGHRAEIVCWDDERVDYKSYDIAIVRSCWDYDKRLSEFLKRLEYINQHTILLNPYKIIRKNTDKRYILELGKRDVPIVPTLVIEDIKKVSFPESWEQVIVKPTVSASGRDTGLYSALDKENIYAACIAIAKKGKTPLLQEYQSSVEEYGERSSVMIAGQITFTMKKTPKHGGFLVHKHRGGTYIPVKTNTEEEDFLNLLTSRLDEVPLYMRVDYLRSEDNSIGLLELEQIEPNLYLSENEKGLKLLVEETLKRA